MLRVFIVEDNRRHLATLEAKTRSLGYEVAGTSNGGVQTLDVFKKNPGDVVLMDIHLNNREDGIELASRLKAATDVPIIFTTAMSTDHLISRAVELSPVGYLSKPINPVELKASIELAARIRKQRREFEADCDYLTIRTGQKLRKVLFEEIAYIKVESKNYVTIVDQAHRKFVVKGSLKNLFDTVLPGHFLRTHSGHGVNLTFLQFIDEFTQEIHLTTGDSVPIGRMYKKAVYDRMNIR